MSFERLYDEMNEQLKSKSVFSAAKEAIYSYVDNIKTMDVYPSAQAQAMLENLTEPMPVDPGSATEIIELLHEIGSKNTVAATGGRYFGFVNGSVTPVGLAAKWLSDTWDQSTALYVLAPIASKLEDLCEKWLVVLFQLPENTAAGLVSGSSLAIMCGLAAARNDLLARRGWDVTEKGLFGAPPIRVVVGQQAHATIWKSLATLGIGKGAVEVVPTDKYGRMQAEALPALDSNTLLILQAGNVNGGAFDPIDEICDVANEAKAWVHIDGAFGLWAAACEDKKHLTKGIEKADSWAVDAHKTLNSPYGCGIVLCKNRQALVNAMQASGSYIQFSEKRDSMLYTLEMSKRARCVELWATLKYLGKSGIDGLVKHLCEMTEYFSEGLRQNGFIVDNAVEFNQIIVRCDNDIATEKLLDKIQASGKCWCGGAKWNGNAVIRLSICSWQTNRTDIEESIKLFSELKKASA